MEEEHYENKSHTSYMLEKIDDLCKLEFIVGEAEILHQVYPENSVDCIVSIESSNWFGDLEAFFKSNYIMLRNPSEEEVLSQEISEQESRIGADERLNETGLFIYADYFDVECLDQTKQIFSKYFDIVKSENITANVLHWMEIDGEKRKKSILDSAWYMKIWCRKYRYTRLNPLYWVYKDLYSDFKRKKKVYYSFVLQKKERLDFDSDEEEEEEEESTN
jgi:hypothetical protein